MKTLASLLLISATLASAAAYAHERSDELAYPPTISQNNSPTRPPVVAELPAVRADQATVGEIDEPASQLVNRTPPRIQVQVKAIAAPVRDPVAFGSEGRQQWGLIHVYF